MEIYSNAYYNYRKHRWAKEAARKRDILRQIQTIYHEIKGVVGYRRMQIYLARNGIDLSAPTVHKYMNTELGLRSIVRRKAPRYQGDTQHKTFENLRKKDFTALQINQKWATAFTYVFLVLQKRLTATIRESRGSLVHLNYNMSKRFFSRFCEKKQKNF